MALSRRSFVAGSAVIPLALWMEKNGLAAGPFVRYDATSAQGKAMLKIYAGAVQKMRNAPITEGNPRSWTFQWYTHQVKGSISQAAQNRANAIAAIYPTPSAWKNLALEMWNTCQAHLGQPENYFLPWHRMYVFYFEQIIRAISGQATFTLPYWNYSVPKTNPNHGVIPPEFRLPNDPTFGSLYVNKRNAGVNNGTPIDQGQPDDPLSLIALRQCTYGPSGANQGFNATLDFGLHGNVHVLTGNSQNMGAVPWAAFDPIFWLHHCNIDRLWASWNAAGRKNPSDSAFLNKTFVFADGQGNRVVGKIGDFLDIAKLGYSYERLEPPMGTCPLTLPVAAVAIQLVAKPIPIPLGPGPVRATLTSPPSAAPQIPLTTRVEKLPSNHRLFLVLRNIVTTGQPDVLYNLYLQDEYAGTINFFEHEHHHEGAEAADKFVSFDITDLAKRLLAAKKLTATPELTFAPAGKPAAEAKPVIGSVEIVEQ